MTPAFDVFDALVVAVHYIFFTLPLFSTNYCYQLLNNENFKKKKKNLPPPNTSNYPLVVELKPLPDFGSFLYLFVLIFGGLGWQDWRAAFCSLA